MATEEQEIIKPNGHAMTERESQDFDFDVFEADVTRHQFCIQGFNPITLLVAKNAITPQDMEDYMHALRRARQNRAAQNQLEQQKAELISEIGSKQDAEERLLELEPDGEEQASKEYEEFKAKFDKLADLEERITKLDSETPLEIHIQGEYVVKPMLQGWEGARKGGVEIPYSYEFLMTTPTKFINGLTEKLLELAREDLRLGKAPKKSRNSATGSRRRR